MDVESRVQALKRLLNKRFFYESATGERCKDLSLGNIAFIRRYAHRFTRNQLLAAHFAV